MSLTAQLLAQFPDTLAALRQTDRLWQSYREGNLPIPTVVTDRAEPLASVDWDVVICGGTLGILMGAALAQRGWRVLLLERGILRGRSQEWNISRSELQTLVELELLTADELESTIASEYNPARLSFHKGIELWVEDVLNIGVDPVALLDLLKVKFLAAGGVLQENVAFAEAIVCPNGVEIIGKTAGQEAGETYRSRLLLDAMGHFSPISQQARQGRSPDAVCLVVGTCAQGFTDNTGTDNTGGDLMASTTPITNHCQYFWEAFPARDGRTTYLFTYLDAQPQRPSLEALFDDYFQLLPTYQNINLDQLQIQRALFGFFPCYRQSPLRPLRDRILPIGDSSGSQSPLSFGGFGAMIRHLPRLTHGIHAALQQDLLQQKAIAPLQPYQPNLAVTWLFQRSMSVGLHQTVPPDQINDLLSGVFAEMEQLGDDVLRPFLQDVVQFPALLQTLLKVSLAQPLLVLKVIPQVGLPTLITWVIHYMALGIYAGLYPLVRGCRPLAKKLTPAQQYWFDRWLDALQYGSGNDLEG
jgi:lycopene cyclase CruP